MPDIKLSPSTAKTPPPVLPTPAEKTNSGSLPGPKQLISESFELLKKRWKPFIGLYILMFLVIFGISAIVGILGVGSMMVLKNPLFMGVGFLLFFILILGFTGWFQASILLVIGSEDSSMGAMASLKAGWKRAFPLVGVLFLTILIMYGGFILFVIPGLVFMVWFMFATYVVVFENKSGFNALMTSREYVRGNALAIIGRLLVMMLIVYGVMILVSLLGGVGGDNKGIGIFIESIVSIVVNIGLSIFAMGYMYLLYKHLRALKQTVEVKVSGGMKAGLIAVALLGLMVPLFAVIAFIAINPKEQIQKALEMEKSNQFVMPSGFPTLKEGQTQFNEEDIRKMIEESLPTEMPEAPSI